MADLDATLLLRDLTRVMVATRAFLALRRTSPALAAERDPFAAARWVTERSNVVAFREQVSDPASPYLLGWMTRLLLLRVNADAETAAASAREPKVVRVTVPEPLELSIRDAVHRVVSEPSAEVRAAFGDALALYGADAAARERDAWARRGEIARRLGLAHEGAATSPLPVRGDMERLALEVLDATHPIARHACARSRTWTDALALASGREPPLPWPGRLSMRAVVELFRGEAGWLDLPELVLGDAPPPRVPASFARALARLGARWADASASRALPLPLAHAPSELPRRTLGALFASLLTSTPFLLRTMGFSRSEAERAARAMARVSLLSYRLAAARVLLREPALAGDEKAVREVARTHVARALLAPFPAELALVVPRLGETDPARLVAFGEAMLLRTHLRDRYDEDWFRNPRAVIELRDRLGRAPELTLPLERARAGATALGSALATALA